MVLFTEDPSIHRFTPPIERGLTPDEGVLLNYHDSINNPANYLPPPSPSTDHKSNCTQSVTNGLFNLSKTNLKNDPLNTYFSGPKIARLQAILHNIHIFKFMHW